MQTTRWYKPRSGDVVWRRHPLVLLPRIALPSIYGLSWVILAAGSYLSGACGREVMMILLFIGAVPTTFWLLFHVDDWRDEVYVLSNRLGGIVYQSRHPFSWETGKRLDRKFVSFTTATLGLPKKAGEERLWSVKGFFYWLFGCGSVSVFGPSARIALEMLDVFNPAQKKEVLDQWLRTER